MISLGYPMVPGFEYSHIRHLYEALHALAKQAPNTLTIVSRPEACDFAFDEGNRAERYVYVCRIDPHAMARDFDVRELIDPYQRRLMEIANSAEENAYLLDGRFNREAYAANPEWVPIIDRHDIFAPSLYVPYVKHVLPRLTKAQTLFLPMSVPEWIFHATLEEARPIDVFFLGCISSWYPLRRIVMKALETLQPYDVYNPQGRIKFWHAPETNRHGVGGWMDSDDAFDAQQRWYADCLRHSKVMIFDGGIYNYAVQKYFECMACGCLVLAPLPSDADRLGFIDGQTMVAIDHENFMDKLRYYLEHGEDRMRIVRNAHRLVMAEYTCGASARTLVRKLQAVKDGVPVSALGRFS